MEDIINGCDLKIKEPWPPTLSKNSLSVARDGPQVADAIAGWVNDGIAKGPFLRHEIPPDATIVRMSTAPKHDKNEVRIILDMSSPAERSVNDACGYRVKCKHDPTKYKKVADYRANMGGTKELLRALNYAGRGAWLTKNDWRSAYKHLFVKRGQRKYQYIEFGGRYFVEVCLAFGHINSPGLYDRCAALPVLFAVRIVELPPFLAIQHLDDVVTVCLLYTSPSPRD